MKPPLLFNQPSKNVLADPAWSGDDVEAFAANRRTRE